MMPEEQKPYEIVPMRIIKLSKPQAEVIKLLNDGGTLRKSKYFYGFEMTLKNGDKTYFRRDTVKALMKRNLLTEVTNRTGEFFEVNHDCDC